MTYCHKWRSPTIGEATCQGDRQKEKNFFRIFFLQRNLKLIMCFFLASIIFSSGSQRSHEQNHRGRVLAKTGNLLLRCPPVFNLDVAWARNAVSDPE
jgi:hypothetical protein